ncbi:PspC domain-containing protein [Pseudonocardia phyllosphaerae]|uniref:PspC domain-containing protein n=1 Tax=Pseudonocardia phyllosphaerae TaxID=3390502 RepID=UPI00397DA95C
MDTAAQNTSDHDAAQDSTQDPTALDATAHDATAHGSAAHDAAAHDSTAQDPAGRSTQQDAGAAAAGTAAGAAPAGPSFSERLTAYRMYRSAGDSMLGGVCGGLGRDLGVDPALLRLAVLALTVLTGGAFALLYLAVWIVAPVR